jgi:hypothetical protein
MDRLRKRRKVGAVGFNIPFPQHVRKQQILPDGSVDPVVHSGDVRTRRGISVLSESG